MKRMIRLAACVLALMTAVPAASVPAYAKTKTTKLKAVTLAVGKSRTVKASGKRKIKWTVSNRKTASVRPLGKTKVRVTGKKAGETKVTGKAGKNRWIFTVKVRKGKKTGKSARKGKFRFKVNYAPSLIRYYAPGIAAHNTDAQKYTFNSGITEAELEHSFISFPKNISSAAKKDRGDLNQLRMTVSDRSRIACVSSNNKIVSVKKTVPWKYITCESADTAIKDFSSNKKALAFALIPHKAGTATITVKYPSGTYRKKVKVEPSAVYAKVRDQMAEISSSGLDDAHKALLIAGYQSKLMKYDNSKKENRRWHTLYEDIIDGIGVCDDYAKCYNYFCTLAGIKSRYVVSDSGKHAFNQVRISGKWYNVDVTWMDDTTTNWISTDAHFLTSSSTFWSLDGGTVVDDAKSDRIYDHVPADSRYITYSTAYDNYDWESFIETNEIAQKLKLDTFVFHTKRSIQRGKEQTEKYQKELEEIKKEQQKEAAASVKRNSQKSSSQSKDAASNTSAYADMLKKRGFSDDEIKQVLQYKEDHPDQIFNVSRINNQLVITPVS